jgi:hypothetical protein
MRFTLLPGFGVWTEALHAVFAVCGLIVLLICVAALVVRAVYYGLFIFCWVKRTNQRYFILRR